MCANYSNHLRSDRRYPGQVLTGDALAGGSRESIVGTGSRSKPWFRHRASSARFAGCMVIDGLCPPELSDSRVLRKTTSSFFEGALESLKRFKDDVNEVRAGTECGIGVKELQRRPRKTIRIEC